MRHRSCLCVSVPTSWYASQTQCLCVSVPTSGCAGHRPQLCLFCCICMQCGAMCCCGFQSRCYGAQPAKKLWIPIEVLWCTAREKKWDHQARESLSEETWQIFTQWAHAATHVTGSLGPVLLLQALDREAEKSNAPEPSPPPESEQQVLLRRRRR